MLQTPLLHLGEIGQVRPMAGGPFNAKYRRQLRERRAEVHDLMLAGYTLSQIERLFHERGLSQGQARRDYYEISEGWSKQTEGELQHSRAQAIQRIRMDLARMRSAKEQAASTKKGKKKQVLAELEQATWKDITSHEMLLARIEGTLRPVEIKVDVRASSRRALIETINAMSPEEMDSLVAEQKLLEAKLKG